jgi:hypothetical protein
MKTFHITVVAAALVVMCGASFVRHVTHWVHFEPFTYLAIVLAVATIRTNRRTRNHAEIPAWFATSAAFMSWCAWTGGNSSSSLSKAVVIFTVFGFLWILSWILCQRSIATSS